MRYEKRDLCFKCKGNCEGCFYSNECLAYNYDNPELPKAQDTFAVYSVELCHGRHDIPDARDGYIFEKIDNPRDVAEMQKVCKKFFAKRNIKFLRLYVTGLSQALCVTLAECQRRKIEVKTMHWDRDKEEYYEVPTVSL